MNLTLSVLAQNLSAWALILPGIYALGRLFRSFVPVKDRPLRGICYCAIGLILLSYSVVFISAMHLLKPAVLWTILLIAFVFSMPHFIEFKTWLGSWKTLFEDRSAIGRILSGSAAVLFLGLLIGTLTPEIGGDTLTYQLDLPKQFLRSGSINPIPFNDNSYFPLFMNNLYLIGLATGGVYAAKFFHFITGIFMALATARILQIETKSSKIAVYAGSALLVTPVIYNMLSTTYIDVSVAFYIFLALVCLIDAFRGGHSRSFFLSGLFAGITLATKYLSMSGVLSLALTAIIVFFITEKRNPLKHTTPIALWILGGLIACGYWLIRNWIHTGNPFYPYWGFLFGLNQRPPINYYDTGMGKNLFGYVFALFNMSVFPEKFGVVATRISPIYFFLIPLAFIAAVKRKNSRPYFIFFLIFYTIWFNMVQMDRWIISALPALLICAGIGIAHCDSSESLKRIKALKIIPTFGCILLLLLETAAGIRHYRHAFYLYSGKWSLADYEVKMERTVPIARWINANTPENAVVMIESEPRKFYIKRTIIEDKNLDWETKYHSKISNPSEIRDFLKSYGITHILLSDSLHSPGKEASFLKQIAVPEYSKFLIEIPSENIRDERFMYRFYELTS